MAEEGLSSCLDTRGIPSQSEPHPCDDPGGTGILPVRLLMV